jgi:hypothetical protein
MSAFQRSLLPSFSVDPEDKSNNLIRNVVNYLPTYCELYPKIFNQNGVGRIFGTADEKLRWSPQQEL